MREAVQEFMRYDLFTVHDHKVEVADLIFAVIFFLIIQLVLKLLSVALGKLSTNRVQFDKGKRFTIVQLVRYVLYIIFIYVVLEFIGFDVTALLVGSAALLVGIGLGLQQLFNDFISGIVILFEGNMQVGDIIEVDDLVCKVDRIDLRTSKVVTRDGNYITIPNGQVISGKVTNWSLQDDESRFRIRVGVAYGSDTQLVKQLLTAAAKKNPDVLKNRAVTVLFQDFGDSALVFDLFFWAKQSWNIPQTLSDIRFEVDAVFRQNGIQIPFPQRDVWMRTPNEGGES